jgi:hypothetical protein
VTRADVRETDGGTQVFLWVGVIFYGRMLPYIGNAF